MRLEMLYPDKSAEDVRENSEFEIHIPDVVEKTAEPTEVELQVLRNEVDPLGYIIGRA
jgi:hypothetical protein